MIIYKAEANIQGLADKILGSQSIAYTTKAEAWAPTEREQLQKHKLSTAFNAEAESRGLALGAATDADLFFTKSILVSTNWNKNDDVFTPSNTWAARHTPSHKRTNLEHDEKQLVGHITDTWALDSEGNLIPDDTVVDDLPELFHLANGAVIYTSWRDSELIDRTNELIGQIEAGKKFVSMEAGFTNFDYAVVTPDEEYHILARCQDTAFLTKHLRIYGGTGIFDGCTIGRLLRNITFSGKGYVDQPANPYSVIFDDAKAFNYAAASLKNPFKTQSGVSYINETTNNQETHNMSAELNLLADQNKELKSSVADLQDKVDQLTKASSEAGVKALEANVSDLQGKLEASNSELTEVKASVVSITAEKDTVDTELTEAKKAAAKLEEEIAEAHAAKIQVDRVAHLVSGGVDKEVAEKKVETFADLSDEQFSSVADDIIAVANKDDKAADKKKADDKKKDAKASDDSDDDTSKDDADKDADASVLEDAKASDDLDLSTDATKEKEEALASLREELQMAVASQIGRDVQEDSNE